MPHWLRWTAPGLAFGADYNPVRYGGDAEFCFLVNLTDDPVAIGDISGSRLAVVGDGETIAPGGVAVLQHSTMDGPHWSS